MKEENIFTLKDVLKDLVKSCLLLKKWWYIIVLTCIASAFIGFSNFETELFDAETEVLLTNSDHRPSNFIVSESYGFEYSTPSLTGSEFGVIVKSNKIIDSVLYSVVEVKGKKDFVYEHFYNFSLLEEKNDNLIRSKKVSFCRSNLQKNIEISNSNENIIVVNIKSHNPEFGIILSNLLIEKMILFIKKIGLESEINFKTILTKKRDSLSNLTGDYHKELLSKINLQHEVSDLKIARFKSNIEVLSWPDIHMKKSGKSILTISILFGLVGALLSSLLIILVSFIKENI